MRALASVAVVAVVVVLAPVVVDVDVEVLPTVISVNSAAVVVLLHSLAAVSQVELQLLPTVVVTMLLHRLLTVVALQLTEVLQPMAVVATETRADLAASLPGGNYSIRIDAHRLSSEAVSCGLQARVL